jgi:hypothetical protein
LTAYYIGEQEQTIHYAILGKKGWRTMYASAMLDEYYTTPLAYLNEVIMFRKNFYGRGVGDGAGEGGRCSSLRNGEDFRGRGEGEG